MPIPTRQYLPIQEPFIRLPLRDASGVVELIDLWREDRLDPDPDGDLVYLVLDFSMEQRLRQGESSREYDPTGSVVIDLQAVSRETGEGLALPHSRTVNPVIPERPKVVEQFGVIVAYEFSTRPLVGLVHLPVSPRRAAADPGLHQTDE